MNTTTFQLNDLMKVALWVLLFFFPVFAQSVEVKGLYSASVELDSQGADARNAGFEAALRKVLIKVSGDEFLVDNGSLLRAFTPFESYVLTFTYHDNPLYLEYLERKKIAQNLESEEAVDSTEVSTDSSIPTASYDMSEDSSSKDSSSKHRASEGGFTESGSNASFVSGSNLSQSEAGAEMLENLPEVEPAKYLMDVKFAKAAIDSVLTAKGVKLWGKSRPSVLLWFLKEDNGDRSLVGDADIESVVPSLNKEVNERGLSAYLPFADLEDQMSIDISLLWGLFAEGLPSSQASRYRRDASVIVTLSETLTHDDSEDGERAMRDSVPNLEGEKLIDQNEKTYSVRWRLIVNDETNDSEFMQGAYESVPQSQIASQLLKDLAKLLAGQYSVAQDTSVVESVNIVVNGINDFNSFIALKNYMSGLAPISSLRIDSVIGDQVSFSAHLLGDVQKLQQHIDLGGRLVRMQEDIQVEMQTEVDLFLVPQIRFNWRPLK